MSASALSSRAIIGSFYRRLKQNSGLKWVEAISNYFQSDQDSETYNWLGQVPVMREWAGGRQAKGFTTNGLTIENKHFEATLEVPVKDLRRDKTGQTRIRINELADRTNSHWAQLLSKLIVNGESTVCYDGQYFFDTDHEEGKSGQQSNKITYTGETGETSLKEDLFRRAMLKGVESILSYKDDQGEPFNEDASRFLIMEVNETEPEYIVRRLTPTECARLQGFPDWWCAGLGTDKPTEEEIEFWTEVFETHRSVMGTSSKPKSRNQIIKWLKNPHSDSAEYKMWGNGVALPNVYFVLSGIVYYSQFPDFLL